MELTGLADTDLLIFSQLDDLSLGRACRVNSHWYSLFQNEHFWYSRTLNRYSSEVLQCKPPTETHRKQYRHLAKVNSLFEETKKGRLDSIIITRDDFSHINRNPYVSSAAQLLIGGIAAEEGHIHILDWLERNNLLPSKFAVRGIMNKDGINWLRQRGVIQNDYWVKSDLAKGTV